MNTLSYGLLALLAQESCTGYELMLKIQPVWQAKHSQIYPILAKMERSGLVQFVSVAQKEKPDKKVYSITEKGTSALQAWLPDLSAEPVKRDEMLLKMYCLWLADAATTERLFRERLKLYAKRMEKFRASLAELEGAEQGSGKPLGVRTPSFGKYVLLKRAIDHARMEIDWCEWVLGMLKSGIDSSGA
ncbi:PadR family transcriptional regulator [Paenibacillus doosanensis]|uniref:Transcriptional regulator PadR-like family protein n=1 Tax=Paenibacillus konkukensis TaxID=2020716 RepID=A0ABY4RUR9_9BACL|nr:MULTISPECIES: PadR family transcriptional regulator [Paenibacillus]MCS7462093.1 PadR family transcriptional regulator [Paenibacillus doosanensis]UQZ85162.1 Transcriptional regulator PadR-like family protein [Paenibacillus konkukensis]